MSDLFKSALSYFTPSGKELDNEFVGQAVELGGFKLSVKRVIAEGGFAFVFVAVDQQGREFALKRLLASDKETYDAIVQEICFMKKLNGHPNIVRFFQAASVSKDESQYGRTEFLALMELCKNGQLVDFLRSRTLEPLTCDQVLQVFYQAAKAVQHMHSQDPPIIHRDLKIENLLLDCSGQVKLCDFGSATTKTYHPNMSWTAAQRSNLEDEMNSHTTPMYRAPEMLDLYQNYPINPALDIWALGCVLYYLCFMVHPFEDSAKLRIINAKYTIPENNNRYSVFHDLIYGMLQVIPQNRPSINEVVERLEEIAAARETSLNGPPQLGLPVYKINYANMASTAQESAAPSRPPPPLATRNQNAPQAPPPGGMQGANYGGAGAPGGAGLFDSLKGGAGSLFKSLKDTSSKVMQNVQATIQKTDLDFKYITSRVAVMNFPAEGIEAAYKNNADEVRTFLDARHFNHYAVYNLSQRQYKSERFYGRVSNCGWPQKKAPSLHNLFVICKNMHLWLKQDAKNICVVHCLDGKANSALLVCAFLIYCRLFDVPERAVQFFCAKRGLNPELEPSALRYLHYVRRLLSDDAIIPHNKPVMMVSISIQPVPLFNRLKTGCRPFVEIFNGEDKIYSSATQEYERMRQCEAHEGRLVIPLELSVTGDITVILYHARSTIADKAQKGKFTGLRIFQVQFHTGFLDDSMSSVQFKKDELDGLDEDWKYPSPFCVNIDVSVARQERPFTDGRAPAYYKHNPRYAGPKILFASSEERNAILSQFCAGQRSERLLQQESHASDGECTPGSSPQHQASGVDRRPAAQIQSDATGLIDVTNAGRSATPTNAAKPPAAAANDFLQTLNWDGPPGGTRDAARRDLAPSPAAGRRAPPGRKLDAAEQAEWDAGIRVSCEPPAATEHEFVRGGVDENDLFADRNQSDGDLLSLSMAVNVSDNSSRQSPSSFLDSSSRDNNVDLLGDGFGAAGGSSKVEYQHQRSAPMGVPPAFDPFADFGANQPVQSNSAASKKAQDDWFNDFSNSASSVPNGAPAGGDNLLHDWSDVTLRNASAAAAAKPPSGAAAFRHVSSTANLSAPLGGMTRTPSAPNFAKAFPNAGPGAGPVPPGQQQQQNRQSNNPFGDLGDLGSLSQPRPSGAAARATTPLVGFGQSPQFPGPSPPSTAAGGPFANAPFRQHSSSPAATGSHSLGGGHVIPPPPQPCRSGASTPTPGFSRPNYGRCNFDSVAAATATNGTGNNTGIKKVGENAFDDLLNAQGFSATGKSQGPTSLKEMKREIDVRELTVDEIKIRDWTEGKRRNIRALLCSMHLVVWEGNGKWEGCNMSELLSAAQVKKHYRKACLAIHPDKLTGTPHEDLAKLIFTELNDAWNEFENAGMPSLG